MTNCFFKIACLFLLSLLAFAKPIQAQTYIYVDSISIEGIKKTNARIISRELDFEKGDSLEMEKLAEIFERNEFQLMNAGIFNQAKLNLKDWNTETNHARVHVKVDESWYIYPLPVVLLADRNINEWWTTYNHSFKRVNYGMRLFWSNFTGNRDKLKLGVQFGFTRKYEIKYELPGFNKSQTLGLNMNVLLSRNKEVAANTIDNKLDFISDLDSSVDLFRRFRTRLGLTYRPGLFSYHILESQFRQFTIADFIAQDINPDYFLDGRTQQRAFSLRYNFQLDRRDIRPYPLKGFLLSTTLFKNGLGVFEDVNALQWSAMLAKYFTLNPKWSLETIGKFRLALIDKKQPYYNNRGLGYDDDFLRGYELYVIDGQDYYYTKTSLHFELLNRDVNLGKYMPISALKVLPLKIYFSLHGDTGYVNNPFYADANPFSNRFLYGYGVGIHAVTYYSQVIRLEYSFNHLEEGGVFLSISLGL